MFRLVVSTGCHPPVVFSCPRRWIILIIAHKSGRLHPKSVTFILYGLSSPLQLVSSTRPDDLTAPSSLYIILTSSHQNLSTLQYSLSHILHEHRCMTMHILFLIPHMYFLIFTISIYIILHWSCFTPCSQYTNTPHTNPCMLAIKLFLFQSLYFTHKRPIFSSSVCF